MTRKTKVKHVKVKEYDPSGYKLFLSAAILGGYFLASYLTLNLDQFKSIKGAYWFSALVTAMALVGLIVVWIPDELDYKEVIVHEEK